MKTIISTSLIYIDDTVHAMTQIDGQASPDNVDEHTRHGTAILCRNCSTLRDTEFSFDADQLDQRISAVANTDNRVTLNQFARLACCFGKPDPITLWVDLV